MHAIGAAGIQRPSTDSSRLTAMTNRTHGKKKSRRDGKPRPKSRAPSSVPMTPTRPPGTRTNFSHPSCYARELNDCDDEISKEHYISESVLEALGGQILVSDPRREWIRKPIGTASLASKILCKRHNNALSKLDAVAKKFVPCLLKYEAEIVAGGGSDRFNGHDIERWVLKAFCSYITLDDDSVPEEWLRILFGDSQFAVDSGLHLNVAIGEAIGASANEIAFETARNDANERTGCSLTIHGYRLLLGMNGKRQYSVDELGKLSLLRPSYIRWLHTRTRVGYRIAFSWQPGRSGDGLDLEWAPPLKITLRRALQRRQ
jgi:hypothetical protein